jgi:hypothetical protein
VTSRPASEHMWSHGALRAFFEPTERTPISTLSTGFRDYFEIESRAFCARWNVANSFINRIASRLVKS